MPWAWTMASRHRDFTRASQAILVLTRSSSYAHKWGLKDWKKAGSSLNTVSLGSRFGEDMGADQQLGLTRKRDWAGSTGRAGRSDDRQRLACLFCMGSSLFVTVSSTAGMSGPGKAN
jgi:hypothetical protein